jgi:STIP1 family protein 1
MEALRGVFEAARPKEEKRREVPDWAVDDISFCVMVDPVIVSNFLQASGVVVTVGRGH